jgi:hypothetical protein
MRKLLALTSILALAAPLGAFAQDAPAAPGGDTLMKVCTACHGLDDIQSERHDAQGWRDVVNSMIGNGAQATPAEADLIVQYLAATYPAPGATAPAGSATPNPPAPANPPAAATPAAPAAAAAPAMAPGMDMPATQ